MRVNRAVFFLLATIVCLVVALITTETGGEFLISTGGWLIAAAGTYVASKLP